MKIRYLVCGLLVSGAAHALDVDMKPGLWEYTFKVTGAGINGLTQEQVDQANDAIAKMKKQLENLPPEQRKMMEDMMQKHGVKNAPDGGIQYGESGLKITKDGTKIQACVTQDDLKKGNLPKPDENCEQKITQVTKRNFLMEFECKGEHPTKGNGEVVFADSTSYSGKMKITTNVQGKQQTFDSEQSGKWLSSDCGNVKSASAKQ